MAKKQTKKKNTCNPHKYPKSTPLPCKNVNLINFPEWNRSLSLEIPCLAELICVDNRDATISKPHGVLILCSQVQKTCKRVYLALWINKWTKVSPSIFDQQQNTALVFSPFGEVHSVTAWSFSHWDATWTWPTAIVTAMLQEFKKQTGCPQAKWLNVCLTVAGQDTQHNQKWDTLPSSLKMCVRSWSRKVWQANKSSASSAWLLLGGMGF